MFALQHCHSMSPHGVFDHVPSPFPSQAPSGNGQKGSVSACRRPQGAPFFGGGGLVLENPLFARRPHWPFLLAVHARFSTVSTVLVPFIRGSLVVICLFFPESHCPPPALFPLPGSARGSSPPTMASSLDFFTPPSFFLDSTFPKVELEGNLLSLFSSKSYAYTAKEVIDPLFPRRDAKFPLGSR